LISPYINEIIFIYNYVNMYAADPAKKKYLKIKNLRKCPKGAFSTSQGDFLEGIADRYGGY
jgi:hypothetical protein